MLFWVLYAGERKSVKTEKVMFVGTKIYYNEKADEKMQIRPRKGTRLSRKTQGCKKVRKKE